ncbi:transposase [Okeania sp. KiyG1]|uniref:transposase n=1 Tax=Okeania sp. KiyG1 TaxID=2720165 RepID=UPI0019250960|nr:transposase [Okeania sp. KiyG1]
MSARKLQSRIRSSLINFSSGEKLRSQHSCNKASQTDNSVGIDLGISTFATLSDGTKIDAPKPLKKRIKKLRKVK